MDRPYSDLIFALDSRTDVDEKCYNDIVNSNSEFHSDISIDNQSSSFEDIKRDIIDETDVASSYYAGKREIFPFVRRASSVTTEHLQHQWNSIDSTQIIHGIETTRDISLEVQTNSFDDVEGDKTEVASTNSYGEPGESFPLVSLTTEHSLNSDSENHLVSDLGDETDSDSEFSWSAFDTTETDTSDDDSYMFSDRSEESSLADDDEFDIFGMLSQQFEIFSHVAPSFFGISLQLFYERLVASFESEEEKDSPPPQHILDSLPTMKVTLAQVATCASCCICYADYIMNEDLLQLPCLHLYHESCIMSWLKIKSTCPTCRLDLSTHKPEEASGVTTEQVESRSHAELSNLSRIEENDTVEVVVDHHLHRQASPARSQRITLRNSSYTTAVEERSCLTTTDVDTTNRHNPGGIEGPSDTCCSYTKDNQCSSLTNSSEQFEVRSHCDRFSGECNCRSNSKEGSESSLQNEEKLSKISPADGMLANQNNRLTNQVLNRRTHSSYETEIW